MSKKTATTLETFDKYDFYRRSVQSPDTDVEFFRDTYRELRGKTPKILREDFCGTFLICCEWVKLGSQFKAHGIDLDDEPLNYGKTHYLAKLNANQRKRIELHNKNVVSRGLPEADLIVAVNFSYYGFKTRQELCKYFKRAHSNLNKKGIFLIDSFGGSQCMEAIEEETEHDDFSYFWDQENYDPVTNGARFHIHFKPKGQKKISNVFSYDWRMWTIPELREIMIEAGFKTTHVYWEGTTDDGEGDGNFTRVEQGEECEAWVAYIAGEK